MAAQTLKKESDHDDRVRTAERNARVVDLMKGDFMVLQSALTSVEKCQDLWSILNLSPATRVTLSTLCAEQKRQGEVIMHRFDNLVSRYDRYLNLVWSPLPLHWALNSRKLQLLNYTNIRMVEGMKQISEENAKQSESMAIVAYDTKRDSEIMKTITVVTMVYLPATFVCVRSQKPRIGL